MKKEDDTGNYIYGKNPVLEGVSKNPKRINKIFIQNNIGLDSRLKKIIEIAKENSIIVSFTNLYTKIGDVPHQGVIASVSPVEFMELDEFLAGEPKKIVILDEISDPHNFGAIIRTCACAGFDGVIVSNHRACPITSTVEKTSSGAVNHISIVKVNSLSSLLDELKNSNWWIIATEVDAKDNYFDIDYTDMNFAIILGAEGKGVNKTLLNKADFKVKIPCNFESLNVSNACAVIVYEAVRQIRKKMVI